MKIIFISLFTAVTTIVTGQQWKNYTNFQTVTCLTTDHDTIWVGTQGGVAKYLIDGTKLANYTHADGLAANYINAIAIDSQNNKWFSTNYGGLYPSAEVTGVSKFDGAHWTSYYTTNNGLSLDGNNSIAVDTSGIVWVGTNGNGISKFDGAIWTNYNTGNSSIPSDYVASVTLDRIGNLWMLGANGLMKYNGTTWATTSIDTSSGLSGIINSMAFDKQNNLWIVYVEDGPETNPGVLKFDGFSWTIYTSLNYGFDILPISVAFDSLNNKWFAGGAGLSEFNDTIWSQYFGPYTGNLCIDQAGNKWFDDDNNSNYSDGLGRFDGTNWTLYNPSESGIAGNEVSAFAADHHGNKWISSTIPTAVGVVKFDGVNWSGYPSLTVSGWSADVSCIAADKTNNIWMGGTYADIYEYDGTNWQDFSLTTYGDAVTSLAVDAQNNKWFCTEDGVFEFNGITWTNYTSTNSGIINNYMSPVTIDTAGNKWFCWFGFVSEFDGSTWTTYDSTNSRFLNSYIITMAIDPQNNKWFGTDSGLVKFDGTNWTRYDTTNSGLLNDWVEAIAFDKEGNCWISCFENLGVTKFDGTSWT